MNATRTAEVRDGIRAGLSWIEAEAADVRELLREGGDGDEVAQRIAGMAERVELARVLALRAAQAESKSR